MWNKRLSVSVAALLVAVNFASCAPKPSFVKKCKIGDNACLVESTKMAMPIFSVGLPEYKVESMDPMKFDYLDVSSGNLKFLLKNITITGFKDCEIISVNMDLHSISAQTLCDALEMVGLYEVDGQVILPIKGNGPVKARLNKALLTVKSNLGEKIKNGKKYFDIISYEHKYELKDKAFIDLQNLFPVNEVLENAARELLKNSPNEIINEIGKPLVDHIAGVVVKNINHFLHRVPVEDLVLE